MEITVISAQNLKTSSSLFLQRLKPFVTLTPIPSPPNTSDKKCHDHQTGVDEEGGSNPTWNDKLLFPLDSAFFANRCSSIFVQVYTKRPFSGRALLGWCQIPVADILDGFSPAGLARQLSYRLRDRDGSAGHGVVNFAVKLEGLPLPPVVDPRPTPLETCQHVIGIPVTPMPSNVHLFSRGDGSNDKWAKA